MLTGAGENFCSGGDVHEIIGPLTHRLADSELLEFTQMTGDLVKAMRACPQPIVAAVDGVCAGAGAILAMASGHCASERQRSRSHSFSCASVLRAATWARARCCRASSGSGAPPSCCTRAARSPGAKRMEWGFFNELCAPDELRVARR